MFKQLSLALTLSLALSACGTHVGASVVAGGGAMQPAQIRTAKAATLPKSLIVLKVDVVRGASPMPGHLMPVSEDFTISGTTADGPFTLLVAGRNPGGNMYMATPESITLNGKKLKREQFSAVAALLRSADVTQLNETGKWELQLAQGIVLVGSRR